MIDHIVAIARKQVEGDFVMRYEPAKVYFESKHADGPHGTHTRIDPIHWEGGPTPDGDTSEFERTLARCRKYMHHFAMHTPQCFIQALSEAKTNPQVRERPTGTTRKPSGGGGRQQKRKAPGTDGNEGGGSCMSLAVWVDTDFSLDPRGQQ